MTISPAVAFAAHRPRPMNEPAAAFLANHGAQLKVFGQPTKIDRTTVSLALPNGSGYLTDGILRDTVNGAKLVIRELAPTNGHGLGALPPEDIARELATELIAQIPGVVKSSVLRAMDGGPVAVSVVAKTDADVASLKELLEPKMFGAKTYVVSEAWANRA